MELPEDEIRYNTPYCHGEPMQPVYRYKVKDVTYRLFECMLCHGKKEVII